MINHKYLMKSKFRLFGWSLNPLDALHLEIHIDNRQKEVSCQLISCKKVLMQSSSV